MDPARYPNEPRGRRERLPTLSELRDQEDLLDWQENRHRRSGASLPLRVKLRIVAAFSVLAALLVRWWDGR